MIGPAILQAYRAGLLRPQNWARNIIAGMIVGVVALPLAMAFAIASGAAPEQGIYTAIVAGTIAALVGGSRTQITGPTGAFIVILAGITAKEGIEGLQLATLMAGVLLVLMGITKLGALIKFIPDPVIVGFTAGIAVIIWVGQWQHFLGLPQPEGDRFVDKLASLLASLPEFHPATTALALFSLATLIVLPRLPRFRRVPGPLVVLIISTAVMAGLRIPGVATIGTAFGGIPSGLPAFAAPTVSLGRIIDLAGPALTIAFLGAIESLLSAVVADGMAGTRHDPNQELIGQGLANIAAPLFGGFAATGALARTATNIKNGGNSPLSGVVHALTLLLVIVAIAPLADYVPLSALAAILFVVAWNMSDARHLVSMVRRAPRADVAVLLVTFGLTVFTDLVIAVNVGVILATLHFLRRMATAVEVQQLSAADIERSLPDPGTLSVPPGVLVYSIDGPFFFAAAETFERALEWTHAEPRALVIRLSGVPFTDITGLQTLEEAIGHLQARGVRVFLCEANARVKQKLRRAGLLALVGPDGYAGSFSVALARAGTVADGPIAASGTGSLVREHSGSMPR